MAKKRSSWAVAAIGFVAGAALVLIILKLTDYFERPEKPAPLTVSIPPEERPAPPPLVTPPPAPEEIPPPAPKITQTGPMLAIVIDDMGRDMNVLRELVQVGAPVTVAVLPNLKHSKETATEAHSKGLEVILHLPMEPKDLKGNDPGKGALLTAMGPEEIRKRMEADLSEVPYAKGINNHMGSRFTEDKDDMRTVLKALKERGMYFLDSRTSSATVAGRLARELGVKNFDRNVFLDNNRDVDYIKKQLAEAISISKKRGKAIAIGHPHPETIQALKESVSELNSNGVRAVPLSELME